MIQSLQALGFTDVQNGPKGDHDIVATFGEETFIFEVKGFTKGSGRREVFDLDRHIGEFETKHPDQKVAKGVLVVNGYSKLPPASRGTREQPIFAPDAVQFAKPLGFALLDTRDLYQAITDLLENRISDPFKLARELRETSGIYRYTLAMD